MTNQPTVCSEHVTVERDMWTGEFSFTDVDGVNLHAAMLEPPIDPLGRPVLEVATDSETGVWMNADQAAAFATWLLEAVKALRAQENT